MGSEGDVVPRATKYGGLSSVEGYGDAYAQAVKASQQANQIGTMAGRQSLLAQQAGSSPYTAGMGRYDAFLTGAAGAGAGASTACCSVASAVA